jgi:hypothetical protein
VLNQGLFNRHCRLEFLFLKKTKKLHIASVPNICQPHKPRPAAGIIIQRAHLPTIIKRPTGIPPAITFLINIAPICIFQAYPIFITAIPTGHTIAGIIIFRFLITIARLPPLVQYKATLFIVVTIVRAKYCRFIGGPIGPITALAIVVYVVACARPADG